MEFHHKIQELRKQKGLTQEELARVLFVSRTAVSKWESGRGYPNIDSLKAIAKIYGVTVDALLSGDELLSVAEEEGKQKESRFRDLVFGLLDCSVVMFFFLPFFGQQVNGTVQGVPLWLLADLPSYLKAVYFLSVIAMAVSGILILALRNWDGAVWVKNKSKISLGINALGVLLFIVSTQPYAATFLFVFLGIKVLMLIKWQ